MYSWSVNGRGQGLLKLDPGWDRDRRILQEANAEITAAGYRITDHDAFWVRLGDCTYYLLEPRCEATTPLPEGGRWYTKTQPPVPRSSLLPTEHLRRQGVVFDHLDS